MRVVCFREILQIKNRRGIDFPKVMICVRYIAHVVKKIIMGNENIKINIIYNIL